MKKKKYKNGITNGYKYIINIVDLKEDKHMTVISKVKQTLTGLQSAQATLKLYEAQSQDDETKKIYQEILDTTDGIVKNLEYRIKTLEYEEPQYKGL